MKYKLGDITVQSYKNDWDRSPRMPDLIMATVFSGLTVGSAAYYAAYVLSYIAVSMITSWVLRALSPKPEFGASGRLVNSRDATAPQQIVYGEVRKGGTVTFMESTGDTNTYLHQVICLAGHELNDIGDVYINDEIYEINSSGYVTDQKYDEVSQSYVTDNKWGYESGSDTSKIRIKKHKGADNQTADSDLVNETSVTSDFKGEGIAYLYVRLTYDQDVFAEGVPNFTAKVQGKKVYDPRTSTTGYSANAALCIRDYLVSKYGLDNDGDTNSISFQAAANTCDESVTLSGGGTESRYEMNGVINLSQSPSDILGDMMTACAGTLFWGQGEWHLKVGEYTSPVKTFTLDDLRGPISLDTKHSRRDNFNIVRGTFNDAGQGYIRADYPEIRSTSFISDDNGLESPIDLALPLTTSSAMAQRLAKMTLYRGREQMTFTGDFGLEAFEVECGDIIALTIDRYGWSEKEFEVVGWKFRNDGEAGDLRVSLTLRETSSAAFSWSAEEKEITGNDSTLTDPRSSINIASLLTSGGGRTTSDGTFINSVIVSWTAPTNTFITHYDVEWKATADSNYSSTTTTQTSIELSPLVDGVEYIIRVRAVTSNGRRGDFATATFTGGGDTTAPALPTSISATGGFKYITINWTNPSDSDLNYIEVYEHTTNTSGLATLVGTSAGNSFTRTNLGLSETRYYFLKSVDYSGNKSAFTSGVSATTTYLDDADFENGVRQLFIDAGLDVIESVSSLPSSGDFTNQQVFLTTDSKLYYWSGSSWLPVVADSTIEAGSITATEIADDAITTPKIAANAVTANEILANTITGGLLATSGIITNTAQINNAVVENANIKDGAISNLKVATGAITEAKIGTGAITTAKIGDLQVDTIKIANQAVSNTGSDEGSLSASSSTTYRTVASVTLSTSAGNQAILWAAGSVYIGFAGQGTPSSPKVRFLRGSTVLEEYTNLMYADENQTRNIPCVIAQTTTDASSTTFHVQVAVNTGGNAAITPTMLLVATELKK